MFVLDASVALSHCLGESATKEGLPLFEGISPSG